MSRGVAANHDALALALAFFEAPGRFPDLRQGRAPLPSGMTELLQVAAGDLPEDAVPMFVSRADLQKAALFFIDQVLLARDADHYRVMGLAPGASAEQVKEHHRLLMRLFHPDRRSAPDERAEAAAARINRGYSVLRGAESRVAYHEALQPAAGDATVNPVYPQPVRIVAGQPPRGLPPALRRHLPQIVLGTAALVAVAAVAMVYVNRVPEGAIGAGALVEAPRRHAMAPAEPADDVEPAGRVGSGNRIDVVAAAPRTADVAPPVQAGERAAAPLSRPQLVAEAAPAVAPNVPPAPVQAATRKGPSAPVSVPAMAAGTSPARGPMQAVATDAPPKSVPAQVVTASTPPSPGPAVATGEPPAPVSVQAVAAGASTAGNTGRAAPAQEAAAAAPRNAPAQAPVAVAAAASTATTAAEPPIERPTAVLERFVVAYERGDLEGLMALFDEDARIERGGRARIRRDYGELFRGSEVRSLRLRDLRWSGEGDLVRAEGAFVARVLRRGEDALRDVAGSIRVELVRRGDRLLIIGLYHTAG